MSEMLDRIRAATGWNDVREERRSIRWLGASVNDRVINLVPADHAWPEIYFVFSDDYDLLQQFGMSEWHGHPEIDDAIALAAELVAGRKCVLERWTRDGKYSGSGLVGPNDTPKTLGTDGKEFLRRVFFNQPPPDMKDSTRKPATRREAK